MWERSSVRKKNQEERVVVVVGRGYREENVGKEDVRGGCW